MNLIIKAVYIFNFTHPYDLLIVPFENSLLGPENDTHISK
jgi:hypothetical protein